MKIALNITPALRATTGIGTYAKEVTLALLNTDKRNEYITFSSDNPFSKETRFDYSKLKAAHKSVIVPYKVLNFFWNEISILPVELMCGQVDIFHSFDMLSPFAGKAKVISTVHDLNWLLFNDIPSFKKKALYKEVERSLKRSTAIITGSLFTKKELLKYFPFLKEGDVDVISLGVSKAFKPLKNEIIKKALEKYDWEDCILYLGVLDHSRKNLHRLVEAYAVLKKRNRIKKKMVLCGRVSKKSEGLLKLIDKLGLKDDIVVHSEWVHDEYIPAIYNMAKLVVYPSLYEGFGLPVLEAFACGKPVITSNLTSIPEVAGDAAYYVDSYDVNSIAGGIEKVLSDNNLYSELVNKGFERVRSFSWDSTASKILKLYERIG